MEVRRSARVASEFLVAIQGLERSAVRRRGNISTTGVYFVTEVDVGPPGMMSWLALSSVDRARTATVMAYVVRSVRFTDIDGRELTGVAFEFIPDDDAAAIMIQDFVRYVLSLRRDNVEPHVAARIDATASVRPHGEPSGAKIRDLTVRSMVLDADWGVAPGERVLVDIFAPGMTNRIRVEGCAVRVVEKPAENGRVHYEIELGIDQQSERPLRSMAPPALQGAEPQANVPLALVGMDDMEVSETIDDLLSALILPPAPPTPDRAARRTHLSGSIAQIPVPTLMSLFEMEQLTGKLAVRTIGGVATFVFLIKGQIVDVECPTRPASPRELLTTLLRLTEGSFELYVQPVERPDRINTRTTALLLDLTRVLDEVARDEIED